MNVWKRLLDWMQNPQQRASFCTIATVAILFLLPGIGWYLIYALWILNSIWSFYQTSDRSVRIIHGVLIVVLAVLLLSLAMQNS